MKNSIEKDNLEHYRVTITVYYGRNIEGNLVEGSKLQISVKEAGKPDIPIKVTAYSDVHEDSLLSESILSK